MSLYLFFFSIYIIYIDQVFSIYICFDFFNYVCLLVIFFDVSEVFLNYFYVYFMKDSVFWSKGNLSFRRKRLSFLIIEWLMDFYIIKYFFLVMLSVYFFVVFM